MDMPKERGRPQAPSCGTRASTIKSGEGKWVKATKRAKKLSSFYPDSLNSNRKKL
jgi:hypothetical protein